MRATSKTMLAAVFALALGALAAPASRAGAVYLGASVGEATIDADDADPDFGSFGFDENDTGWKAFAGVRFLKFFGLEGGYVDFGAPGTSESLLGTDIDLDLEVTGWDAFAMGVLTLGPVELFGKLGGVRWDLDGRIEGGPLDLTVRDDGTDAAYGVGAAVRLGRLSVRGEYERFDIESTERVDVTSVGLELRF